MPAKDTIEGGRPHGGGSPRPEPVAEGARCQHRVSRRTTRTCSRSATVQRGGKGYCSRHDPDKEHSALPLDGRKKFKWMAERLIEGVRGQRSSLYRVPADPSIEHIVAAAVRAKTDGEVYLGDGHTEAVDFAREVHGRDISGSSVSGFWTSSGRFVDRREAMRIARAQRQAEQLPTGPMMGSRLDSAEMRTDVEESESAAADFYERRDAQLASIVREFKAKLNAAAKSPEADTSLEADHIQRAPHPRQMELKMRLPRAPKPDPDAPASDDATERVIRKDIGRISWPRIPAEPLTRIWLVYGKRGTIFDEDGVDRIAEQLKTLIARFYASTDISGHSSSDPAEEVAEVFGRPLTEHESELLQGMLEDEEGNWLLSDYAWRWLKPLYEKLDAAETAEEKLLVIDRILNVVHARSDLAGVFIQGGKATLNKIATQGGHTTQETDQDAHIRLERERSYGR